MQLANPNALVQQLRALVIADLHGLVRRSQQETIIALRPEIYAAQPSSGASPIYTAENKDVITLAAGLVVAVHSSGTGVLRADKGSAGLLAVGLLQAATAAGVAGNVQTEGLLTLADWTAATGAATLNGGAVYYLGSAGALTTVAPSSGYVQRIGRAVNSVTLDISITEGILL